MHVRIHSCAVLAALLFTAPVAAIEQTQDSLDTVRDNLKQKKAVLVDVREDKEWKQGHVLGAMHIPLSTLEKIGDDEAILQHLGAVLEQQIPKDRIVYTHCVAGVRSLQAAAIFKKMGYDARSLEAGYRDLIKAGFPDGREKPKE